MNNRLHTQKNTFRSFYPGCSWFAAAGDLWQSGIDQQAKRYFWHFLNLQIALLVAFALSSCTMVSQKMLPGIEYRENPHVEIIEYDDHSRLQEDCAELVKENYLWISGCTLVPQDPQGKCIIRVMAGDERTQKHELAHCHGHADTFLPWMVDYDFYNTHKRSQ